MENIDSMPCPFCKWYRKMKSLDEYHAGNRDGGRGTTEVKYLAALVQERYYNGCYCGRATNYPEPLNYCPTCGIKLKPQTANQNTTAIPV